MFGKRIEHWKRLQTKFKVTVSILGCPLLVLKCLSNLSYSPDELHCVGLLTFFLWPLVIVDTWGRSRTNNNISNKQIFIINSEIFIIPPHWKKINSTTAINKNGTLRYNIKRISSKGIRKRNRGLTRRKFAAARRTAVFISIVSLLVTQETTLVMVHSIWKETYSYHKSLGNIV